uniref:Uncharacterized protein n=1 Tax=Trypanosoma congolense (strain IL3000) TaxID=1068625 RepID=G0UPK3_TRYCI|nr:conserved hypothetical protein [Trypanosoma congolense IL3000]
MGQQLSISAQIRKCMYNQDMNGLRMLLSRPSDGPISGSLEDNIFVEAIVLNCDTDIVTALVKLANDDQLTLLIATAVLYDYPVPLEIFFNSITNRERAIEEHHLKHLFLTLCERERTEAVRVFIENECYDPCDSRCLRAVVRGQLKKATVDTDLLKLVKSSHPMEPDEVRNLVDTYRDEAHNDEVLRIVEGCLL